MTYDFHFEEMIDRSYLEYLKSALMDFAVWVLLVHSMLNLLEDCYSEIPLILSPLANDHRFTPSVILLFKILYSHLSSLPHHHLTVRFVAVICC